MADTDKSRQPTTLETIWALRSVLLPPAIMQYRRNRTQPLLVTIGERTLISMALAEVGADSPKKTVA